MTKAARIFQLYAQGLSTREIADRIGCRIEYVRVCARQRPYGSAMSKHDKNYAQTEKGRAVNVAKHARWVRRNRDKHNAYRREWSRRRRAEMNMSQ